MLERSVCRPACSSQCSWWHQCWQPDPLSSVSLVLACVIPWSAWGTVGGWGLPPWYTPCLRLVSRLPPRYGSYAVFVGLKKEKKSGVCKGTKGRGVGDGAHGVNMNMWRLRQNIKLLCSELILCLEQMIPEYPAGCSPYCRTACTLKLSHTALPLLVCSWMESSCTGGWSLFLWHRPYRINIDSRG